MKQILLLFIFSVSFGQVTNIKAQPKYKYLESKERIRLFKGLNGFATGSGYLVYGIKGLMGAPYVVTYNNDLEITHQQKIPRKIDGKRMQPTGFEKMGNKYAVFYQYDKKKQLHFGYDLYNPSGGYFDGEYRELTSTKVKKRNRDYYETYVYYDDEGTNNLLILNQKNVKVHYWVFAYWITTSDVKQEMILLNDQMKVVQKDNNFRLKGDGESGLKGSYSLRDFEIDENNNVYILAKQSSKEAKSRKQKKAKKKNIEKSNLGLFVRTEEGETSGQKIDLTAEAADLALSKHKGDVIIMGSYFTDPKLRSTSKIEGIFRVNVAFDENANELISSEPEYYPFSAELSRDFNFKPSKGTGTKKAKKSEQAEQPSKRLPTAQPDETEKSDNAEAGAKIKATIGDIFHKEDGSTIVVMEEQEVIIVETTTTSTDAKGLTSSTTTTNYYYHYNNVLVLKVSPEGTMSYVVLPKETYMFNNEKPKGYEVIDYGNSLVVIQQGKIYEINLDDMSLESKEMKQWKVDGNRGKRTKLDGNNVMLLQPISPVLQVFSLDAPN